MDIKNNSLYGLRLERTIALLDDACGTISALQGHIPAGDAELPQHDELMVLTSVYEQIALANDAIIGLYGDISE